MNKNFFKIVFRNLWRYKSFTSINVIGMGIGIAAMVWGYQSYRFSFSFDKFHKDTEHVYRALTTKKDGGGLMGIFPMAAVQAAKNDFAGIQEAVRYDSRGVNIKYDTSETFSERVHFTDPGFFDIFNFPLLSGRYNINDRNTVLVTEKIARKYFGSKDPVGKVLTFYAGETYAVPLTIKGILKDIPINSTLQFDIITNFDNLLKDDGQKIASNDWNYFLDAAFFKIADPAVAGRIEKQMDAYLALQNKTREDLKAGAFKLVTIRQNAEWRDVISSNNLIERPGDAPAYGPFVLAFLIFFSACLNFSNTAVARANKRLKEIGVRKVMGSTYRQLIAQLLLECSIVVALSVLLSVLLNTWWLPAFNGMFRGVELKAEYFHDPKLLLFIGYMLVGATLLAGGYPAFYLSAFSPTSIFRGNVKFGGSNLFSRVMLGLQLTIAIITVIAGIAFARNAVFQRNYDYGYNIRGIMGLTLNDSSEYRALKNELAGMPGITASAGTRQHIGFGMRRATAESEGSKKEVSFLEVGKEYPDAMQLKIVAGRGFDAGMESDYTNGLLITQKMAAMYNWNPTQALGKRIRIDSTSYAVVGVLKDFHSTDLFRESDPSAIKLSREDRFHFLIVQTKEKDLTLVFQKVKDAWKKLYPLKPFNGFYQNRVATEAYEVTTNLATLFSGFAIISILLTSTGLFALVSLTTLKKMKEIALRKVVGAEAHHIMMLINKGYFWVFIIAAILGCYGGMQMTKLLLNLIFRVNVGVGADSLLWSVIILFLIAGIISGARVWQAVRTNPVKLLRSE